MSKTEDIKRLKQISIIDFLSSLKVSAPKQVGKELYYYSPFRKEHTPSFSVNPDKNVWYDQGIAAGGDIIDLVMRVMQVDMPTAIQMLEQLAGNLVITAPQIPAGDPAKQKGPNKTMAITRIEEFENPILISYLKSRAINMDLLLANPQTRNSLKVIYYTVEGKDKEYYSIGWRNNEGGWELRSKNFQGFIGPAKTFSYIRGTKPGMAIFESFIDYFSALTHFKAKSLHYDILILNSTNLAAKTLQLVLAQPHLHFFLDNDEAGKKTTTWFKNHTIGIPSTNHAEVYAGFKDFNDKLTNTRPKKPLPLPNDTCSELSQTARWWLWVAFQEKDPETNEDKQCVFYSFNNNESGYQQLLYLRAHELDKPKISKLCERIQGRQYKVLEERWHL